MAKKSGATFQKRQREMIRQQRRQDKLARRKAAKEAAAHARSAAADAVDPDLAGIVLGPQAPQPEHSERAPAEKPTPP